MSFGLIEPLLAEPKPEMLTRYTELDLELFMNEFDLKSWALRLHVKGLVVMFIESLGYGSLYLLSGSINRDFWSSFIMSYTGPDETKAISQVIG